MGTPYEASRTPSPVSLKSSASSTMASSAATSNFYAENMSSDNCLPQGFEHPSNASTTSLTTTTSPTSPYVPTYMAIPMMRVTANRDLLRYLRKEQEKRQKHSFNGPLPATSDFDEEGDFLDTKVFRGILRAEGGEGAEVAAIPLDGERMHATLPDGTKAIMADMCNAYHKKRTGKVAYEGTSISAELIEEYKARARAVSGHEPFMSEEYDEWFNADCYERDRDFALTWSEDFEDFYIPLENFYTITQLRRQGKHRYAETKRRLVRDDMPTNPHHFPLCEQGIKAAYVLQGYQENDEQIQDGTPVPLCEQPMLENGVLLQQHPVYRSGYPHERTEGQKDAKVVQLMETSMIWSIHTRKSGSTTTSNTVRAYWVEPALSGSGKMNTFLRCPMKCLPSPHGQPRSFERKVYSTGKTNSATTRNIWPQNCSTGSRTRASMAWSQLSDTTCGTPAIRATSPMCRSGMIAATLTSTMSKTKAFHTWVARCQRASRFLTNYTLSRTTTTHNRSNFGLVHATWTIAFLTTSSALLRSCERRPKRLPMRLSNTRIARSLE